MGQGSQVWARGSTFRVRGFVGMPYGDKNTTFEPLNF